MYNKNTNETLTNDGLCVCEDNTISASEALIIDKVIENYSSLMDSPSRWVTLEEFEKRMRRAST